MKINMVENKKNKIKKSLKKEKKIKSKISKKVSVKKVGARKISQKPVKKSTKKVLRQKKHTLTKKEEGLRLRRYYSNPILGPNTNSWESMAVFNPGVVMSNGRVHLFYRALGPDGLSRIGYASSKDGINFDERLPYPVYLVKEDFPVHENNTSYLPPEYNTSLYSSGGGWGGCEDPRTVKIEDRIYMTFNIFKSWNDIRVGVTSISEKDLNEKRWTWDSLSYLSHPGDRQKNWVIFPEKFNGKFAVFHNLDKGDSNRVHIAFVNKLHYSETPKGIDAPDPQQIPDHKVSWHIRTRSASAPPLKTKDGWLLLYHAMEKNDFGKYKLGALLLDLNDPEKVLYRSKEPILEAKEWYENDWKPGIVYASGAVIKDHRLFVYYGGGDKHIGVASILLDELLESMKKDKSIKLKKENMISLN
ncbi:MAG: hypothetical protein WC898_03605 [Candidatus Paceibacterota bacterium]